MMDEQFVQFEFDVGPGYNYQSARIKQMDARVSEGSTCVAGWRADFLEVGLC